MKNRMLERWKSLWNSPTRQWAGVFFLLAIAIGIVYQQVANSYFVGDDFFFVTYLHFAPNPLLGGNSYEWFIQTWAPGLADPGAPLFIRPVISFSLLLDHIVWDMLPFGYHLTNLLLNLGTTFLLYLCAWRLARNRVTALLAALLFALQPAHLEAVSWIMGRTDVTAGFFYLLAVLFFILFRQRGRLPFLLISLGACGLALLSKEIAITLPLVLLAFDLLYPAGSWRERAAAEIPFWLLLGLYFALRLVLFQQIGGYADINNFDPVYFSGAFTLWLLVPFLTDMPFWLQCALLAAAALALYLNRRERAIWFGAGWTIAALLATVTIAPALRSTYIPSAGACLFLAAALNPPLNVSSRLRAAGAALALCLLALWGWTAISGNSAWASAGQITLRIQQQMRQVFSSPPNGARLYFVGVPPMTRGAYVYNSGLGESMQLGYDNWTLHATRVSKFPILSANLDNTFYFQYARGTVTPRPDLIQQLAARAHCAPGTAPAITWNFQKGLEGWEESNDLEIPTAGRNMLSLLVQGSEPNLDGPAMNLGTDNLGDLEVRMQVNKGAQVTRGRLLWKTTGQSSFPPDQQVGFDVISDGQFHTYRVALDRDDNLYLGDHITRFRFTPTDGPAQVDIQSLGVYNRCAN